MILPTKHIKLSNSLLSVGAVLLKNLNTSHTVTSLWSAMHSFPEVSNYEKFTLGLDFLFVIGAVDFQDGLLRRTKE